MISQKQKETNLLILNVNLWDGTGRETAPKSFLEITEGRISRIGRVDKLTTDHKFPVFDAEDRFVMPGLIDCHVHLVYCKFKSLLEVDLWPIEYHTLRGSRNASTLLSYGFTTVRDVGSRGALSTSIRDAINQGLILGPRIVACGPIICGTGGLTDNIPGGWNITNSIGVPVSGIDEIRKAVRSQIKLGVDCIKVGVTAAEASVYSYTDQTSLSPEELKTLVDEAKRFGKMVACHAQSYTGARMAVECGVTTLEHGTRLDDETITLLKNAKDIYFVPTLCTIYSVLDYSVNPKQVDEMKINYPLWIDSFQRAHRAGVKIASGSDNGNRYMHGEEAKELEFLVKHGFSTKEALLAATRVSSQALHLNDQIGTLEEGKLADLLILNGDPLKDISILQKRKWIHRVVKGGEVFIPDEIAPEVIR
jgi:imidazolonepropionase-like amidohydrolase